MAKKEKLAILGGPKAIKSTAENMFTWPIITKQDEKAALDVLRTGRMSGLDVTMKFEEEYAKWHKTRYALCHCNGTSSLQAAMYGCGIGIGDEVIVQSLTFWASATQLYSLGATPVFAEVDPSTFTIDPNDIEHRITKRTKAIIVVHYCGYPTDMDPIMKIARKHKLKVIEDVSHAHGGLYKGKLVGTIGDVGAMSLMTYKSLAIGEGGVLITNNKEIYERAIAFGHYIRHPYTLTIPPLKRNEGIPFGGVKYRINQIASAVGRVQLKHYRKRMETIQKAMNCFWDLLEDVPGIRAHRPSRKSRCTMGGWYFPRGLYVKEELGGLPVSKFCEAVTAEGYETTHGANFPLHLHPVFNDVDVYGHGKPTRIANTKRDVRQPKGSLPVTESMPERTFDIPWFKHYRPRIIKEHAKAFRKVAEQAEELL